MLTTTQKQRLFEILSRLRSEYVPQELLDELKVEPRELSTEELQYVRTAYPTLYASWFVPVETEEQKSTREAAELEAFKQREDVKQCERCGQYVETFSETGELKRHKKFGDVGPLCEPEKWVEAETPGKGTLKPDEYTNPYNRVV